MLSSKQKGDIAESRTMEIITYSSEGNISCYKPIADDDGVDLIINKKGEIKPLFLQIKSRFKKNRNNRFIQNVGIKTFTESVYFYILFILFNEDSLEIERL